MEQETAKKRARKRKAKKHGRPPRRATYTVDEVAALLGRHRLCIYEDLAAGRIPNRKLSGRYIISKVALHRWLESAAG